MAIFHILLLLYFRLFSILPPWIFLVVALSVYAVREYRNFKIVRDDVVVFRVRIALIKMNEPTLAFMAEAPTVAPEFVYSLGLVQESHPDFISFFIFRYSLTSRLK
jgi:hypothetical protein